MEMKKGRLIRPIAHIHTEFPTKFGIPRQSGLAETRGEIIFEPEYRNPDAVRGLEGYSHLWLIWEFSETIRENWSPTVRTPRLGGNERRGVFATRSPFRPNPIGLSCVKLKDIENRGKEGMVRWVEGADLMDGTPIYDIKPYLPYVDSHPHAKGGFAETVCDYELEVEFSERWLSVVPEEVRTSLFQILSQDPRPSYQNDPDRIYGMEYAGMEVRFQVCGTKLTVCEVMQLSEKSRE